MNCFTFVPRRYRHFQKSSPIPNDRNANPGLNQYGIVHVGYGELIAPLVRHRHSLSIDLDPFILAKVYFQTSGLRGQNTC